MNRHRTLVLALSFGLAAVAPGVAEAPAHELEFEGFNRVYTDLVGELAPVALDPVTVRLSSPRQTVMVRDHRISMRPLGGGRTEGRLEIELLGKGEIVADVDLAGNVSRLADELILPPQRIALDGRVRLARADGGYQVVPEQMPSAVRVEIRSGLIDRVVGACEGAAMLSFGAIDCAPVRDALERPAIPLPAGAGEFFLADADLTAADRAALDALITAAR
ncbi:MAG: hypothetical protein AMXMBFR36_38050 [Acidobacteriota bacterium]